jgi:hypothetical protein
VAELLFKPQFHKSLVNRSLKRVGISEKASLLIIDITPPFLMFKKCFKHNKRTIDQ